MVRLGASAARHVVKAIVFYGRRGSVQMLNCYLERNLRRNGGLLSEVPPVAALQTLTLTLTAIQPRANSDANWVPAAQILCTPPAPLPPPHPRVAAHG